MIISSTRQPISPAGTRAQKSNALPEATEKEPVNSAFSVERDIAYTVGSTIALGSNLLVQAVGPAYGVPQGITTGVGVLMAAAGAKELMENNSLRGRVNGAIHLAVGAMTAAAPWSGNLAAGLYVTSLAALGVKAFADRPGGILYQAGKETVSMAKEVFTKWELNSVNP